MPHSSGGGSSSGGSHGGSSSHSSSGSSGSSVRRSRNPFVGGIRYVYYDRHSAPHYFYSTGEKHSKLRYLILLLYIPFFGNDFQYDVNRRSHSQKTRRRNISDNNRRRIEYNGRQNFCNGGASGISGPNGNNSRNNDGEQLERV